MTDREFLLDALADGRAHTLNEILQRSFAERGCGLTVHSRAADLRRDGYVIVNETVAGAERGNASTYRLVGNLNDIPSLSEGSAEPASARPEFTGPSLSNGSEPCAASGKPGAVGNTAVAQLTLEDAA